MKLMERACASIDSWRLFLIFLLVCIMRRPVSLAELNMYD